MLEDAYLQFHGFVPHHDFKLGQMRRRLGEEGSRADGELDFLERAMLAQLAELRDLGLQVHGNWLDGRVEYWAGIFNGAGTAYQDRANRGDDNDPKDLAFTVRALPVRSGKRWGTLEVGYSILNGVGGESGGNASETDPVDGLDRHFTVHGLQYAWVGYFPAGPVSGWWLRGEWGQYRDRFAPGEAASGLGVSSSSPAPFNLAGWEFSTGYRLDRSVWRDQVTRWLRPLEFAFRYEVMENVFFHDLVYPERRFDIFKTCVRTAGVNYRISDQAKLQLNYTWVDDPDKVDHDDRQLREVRNDALMLNLQVSF